MREKILREKPIPYNKPTSELKELLLSSNDDDFVLACEALSYSKDPEAYELLKSLINHKDLYRKICILSSIFRMPQSSELACYLEKALKSKDILIVRIALEVIADYKVKVSEKLIRSAVSKFLDEIDQTSHEIGALSTLNASADNYIYLTEIFKLLSNTHARELLCDILLEKYLHEKAQELFDLFKYDKHDKIRLIALNLGKKFGFDTTIFLSDDDDLIRMHANNQI